MQVTRPPAAGCPVSNPDNNCANGLFLEGAFWPTGGPLHSLVDRLQRVIMLDKAQSTAKAYIAAFQAMASRDTELKLSTPCQGTLCGPVSPPPGTRDHLMRSHGTVSRHTTVDARKSQRRRPDKATLRSNSYAKPCVAFIVDQSTLLQLKHMGHIWAAYGLHMGTLFATYGAFSTYGEENPSESTTYGQLMGIFFKHMGFF